MNCIRSGEGCKEADPLDKSLTTEHGMQMRLCRCDMGVVTLKEKVLLDDLTGICMEGSGGLHILAAGEVRLEGQEVNLNGNRGVTMYEGKAVPDLEKLLDTEEGALLPEVTVTAAGKVELTTEEGENTVQNRGEKVTYYLAWEHADLSHPSNRYRDEPEQKDYDWAQWRLNIAAGMVVVGSVTILGAVVAGAAAGAGMIAAGNISAGSAAASVGGAVFLTGSLYVAEQAVSDAVSGRLGDTEKYVRKALAGSVVGFLTGASGLMMQGASLGKVLSLGFGEGFLGSTAAQGLLNEDGEINWALTIGDGMFSAVMAGLVWKGNINNKTDNIKKNDILTNQQNDLKKVVNTQGKRNDLPLTKEQYDELVLYVKRLGFPEENIVPYNVDCSFETGLLYGERLYINNDALPSNIPSNDPNSLISGKGAMAHEIIGHYETILKGTAFTTQTYDASGAVKIDFYNLALDEAQASIRAGRFAPDLTLEERLTLIKDGIMRLKKQGIKIREIKDILDIIER